MAEKKPLRVRVIAEAGPEDRALADTVQRGIDAVLDAHGMKRESSEDSPQGDGGVRKVGHYTRKG